MLLAVGAMLRYPGGTALDATTARYSLARNFLSDLGMTVAYNGQPNRVGASLFVGSLLLLVVGFGACLAAIVRLFGAEPASRRWARAVGVCGLLACAAFAGVAVTPENRVMAIHVGFTVWAWRIMPVVAALIAVAAAQSRVLRRRVAVVWTLAAVLLTGYAALLAWGPSVQSVAGLTVQVIAQKAAACLLLSAVLYLAGEADRGLASCRRGEIRRH